MYDRTGEIICHPHLVLTTSLISATIFEDGHSFSSVAMAGHFADFAVDNLANF